MRILVAAASTPGHLEGGMERHLELLVRLLESMGCETHVLTSAFPPGSSWKGGRVHTLDAPAAAHSRPWMEASRAAYLKLAGEAPFQRLISEGSAAAGLLGLPGRPPLAVFLQGFEPEHFANRRREIRSAADAFRYAFRWAPGLALSTLVERRLCRSAEKIWAPSSHILQKVVRWYGVPAERAEKLPNWLEDGFGPSPGDRERHRKDWEAGPPETVFLFNGVLSRQKGARVALSAFDSHARGRPESRLVVLGEGEELEDLKRETLRLGRASRVRFLGRRPNAEVAGLLGAADVFLMPTLRIEGLPYAAHEAARVGLPVVASPLGGLPELLGEHALYCPPGDAPALARAMDRLADSEELRRRLGESARLRAEELFGIGRARTLLESWLEGPP